MTDPTERPRPTPDGSRRAGTAPRPAGQGVSSGDSHVADVRNVVTGPPSAGAPRGQLTRVELQPAQVVAAAGSAIVTAARVGRLLGRSGWRIARQLPGARAVEREAQRLQTVAVSEARRILQVPTLPGVGLPTMGLPNVGLPGMNGRLPTAEEQRAVDYIRNADPGAAPLRSAMGELLERSVESTRTDSREYLYGTIISQLVPDEARILAALADGSRFAAADVVQKQRRGKPRVLVAHACAVGRQAGLVSPDNTPTYLARLLSFGLVEFGPEDPTLSVQYDILATDATVQRARESVEPRRRGAVKIVRSVLQMSPFGMEFWEAADPSRPALPS